jgi:hypothetical protein
VQVDAVEIVARLLGRDRKLRLVDQALQGRGPKRELVGHVAGGEIGEVALRQGLEGKARSAGADRQDRAVAGGLKSHLRAFRQLADDFVEHVRRHGGRARGSDLGRNRLDHLQVEIGGLQVERRFFRAHQHVGEDRNGVTALHHAMHVAQRLQEFCALDGNLHGLARGSGGVENGVNTPLSQAPRVPGVAFSRRFTGFNRAGIPRHS